MFSPLKAADMFLVILHAQQLLSSILVPWFCFLRQSLADTLFCFLLLLLNLAIIGVGIHFLIVASKFVADRGFVFRFWK